MLLAHIGDSTPLQIGTATAVDEARPFY